MHSLSGAVRSAIFCATAVLQLACGDSGVEPARHLNVELSQSTVFVTQGGSVSLTATITGSGGFTGGTFVLSGAPPGVAIVPGTPHTDGEVTSVPMTIYILETAFPGSYQLTGTASGEDVQSKTVQLSVRVRSLVVGSYALSLSPGSKSITRGTSTAVLVNIARFSFPAAVNLVATGLPVGVTATFSPNNTVGNSTALTLSASAQATTGTATITITGSGGGDATNFELRVTPIAGGSGG